MCTGRELQVDCAETEKAHVWKVASNTGWSARRLCDMYLPVDYACRNTHGNYLKLSNSSVLLMSGNTFSSRVIDAWNSLSNDVVKSPSVCIFKKRLHSVNSDRFLTITCWLFLAVYSFLSLFLSWLCTIYVSSYIICILLRCKWHLRPFAFIIK